MKRGAGNGVRVALVHDWLTGMRGGEKVLEAIAEDFSEAPIFTLFHFSGSVSAELEQHPIHTSFLQRAPFARRHYRSYLPFFPQAIEDFDLSGFELVISSSHCVAKGVVPAPDAFHVCYCHSPMRYAWDQERVYFPRRHGLMPRLRGRVLSGLRTWDAASAPRVDLFVANSRFVAERIRRYYGRSAEVVHPPVEVERFFDSREEARAQREDAEPFCLSVAALNPYKRHEMAIEACARLGIKLVIVGDGPQRAQLQRLCRQHAGAVELAGRVSDATLRDLFRRATVFVQPATEDFGMAAVEALASGTPVAAAAAGGVLDVVDHGIHGFLYDPLHGSVGLAQAIDNCRQFRFNLLDLRHRAGHFCRARFKERWLTVLDERLPDALRARLRRASAGGDSQSATQGIDS